MGTGREREAAIQNEVAEDVLELSKRYRPGLAQEALINAYQKLVEEESKRANHGLNDQSHIAGE